MNPTAPFPRSTSERRRLLACARGETPCDLILKNGRVINVFSNEILETDIGITGEFIAGLGPYEGREVIDLDGGYVSPGFIDGHIHIESSMLTPAGFARAVVPHGTTAVVCDPHEIANVAGEEGIRYMLRSTASLPLDLFAMIPSCVPATHMETGGALLSGNRIDALLDLKGAIGLAEMMNFPGTIMGDTDILNKIDAAQRRGLPVDGHAPGVTGRELQAYCSTGISSDHECTTLEEAREKLRAGMYIFIREGSTAKNLTALLPLVTPENVHRFLLVSDDRHPDDLLNEGHLDAILKKTVSLGLDPLQALRMATLNPAQYFHLARRGAVAPGYLADLVVLQDLHEFHCRMVLKNGRTAAAKGQIDSRFFSWKTPPSDPAGKISSSVHVDPDRIDFRIPADRGKIRVIQCIPDEILTDHVLIEPTIRDNETVADPDRDLLKIAVIERHHASGAMAVGFVRGLGMKNSAIGSTVAHDSHNIVVAGTSDALMHEAVRQLTEHGGGIILVGETESMILPLPVAGLMSLDSCSRITTTLKQLKEFACRMGAVPDNPFMLLSFLALPVIPSLRITDQGLVDVERFRIVPLYIDREDEK